MSEAREGADTEPCPPPSGNVVTLHHEGDPVDALLARLDVADEDAGPSSVPPRPSPDDVPGTTAKNPSRDWYDYGKDTGARLRVIGVFEGEEAERRLAESHVAPPETFDRGAAQEAYEASRRALADGDNRALGKLYEDLLDEMHSASFGDQKDDGEELAHAFGELQSALRAELLELSRASERGWGWAFRLTEDGLAVRCKDPRGEVLEVRLDAKATKLRIAHARQNPRASAEILARRCLEEVRAARVLLVAGNVDAVPWEMENAQG